LTIPLEVVENLRVAEKGNFNKKFIFDPAIDPVFFQNILGYAHK
jgi:hypothetical protein